MALILDTNALSAFVDGDEDVGRIIEQQLDLAVPSIVLGEYLYALPHPAFAPSKRSGSRPASQLLICSWWDGKRPRTMSRSAGN